ncbi:MAG: hypothetical protein IJX76_01260 [Clostridia bacterium]|nr:hypothetical protein [Clostridia bacterium]
MKKTLATILATATMLSMASAFSVNAAETATTVDGLSQTSYQLVANTAAWDDAYKKIFGNDGDGEMADYRNMHRFDQTIDELMYWSRKTNEEAVKTTTFQLDGDSLVTGTLGAPNGNNYMLNWTGTMTASRDLTFTLVANKIDNGFVFEMDDTRYYEWWGSSHWLKAEAADLASDLGSITVKAGESYDVNIWFLELTGGDALEIGGYVGDSTEFKSLAELGLTFDLSVDCYHNKADRWGDPGNTNHPYVKVFAAAGDDLEGGDNSQCGDNTAYYDETIEGLLATSQQIGGTVVTPTITPWTPAPADESYINLYEGTFTVAETGYYLFGTTKVDNGLMIQIDDTRVYELWAERTYNNASETWYTSSIKLEAGKTYTITAAYMERDGGDAVKPVVKYSATEDFTGATAKAIEQVLAFKTTVPTDTDMLAPDVAATIAADGTLLTDKIDQATIAVNKGMWPDGAVTNLFDGKKDTKMGGNGITAFVTWQTTEPTTITNYAITTAWEDSFDYCRVPASWTLLGSNDGKTYTIIDDVDRGMGGMGCVNNGTAMYEVDEPAAYTYYRWEVNCANWGGGAVSAAELELYNYDGQPTDPVDPPATEDPTDPTDPVDPPATEDPTDPTDPVDPPATEDPTDPVVTDEPATTTTKAPVTTKAPTVTNGASDNDTGTTDDSAEEDGSVLPIVIGVAAAVVVIAVIAVVVIKKKKQ